MRSFRFNLSKLAAISLSPVFIFSFFSPSALAGLVNEANPAVKEGAKSGIAPKTGLLYWIELNRHGKTMRVNNQQQFVSGDRIRFHVQSTVDGFAYIVLRSGSQGEQAVLFPLENTKDNNRLHRDVDYGLPAGDFLQFDSHPGTEKVTLLFSKHPLDMKTALSNSLKVGSAGGSNHVILRANSGAKDLVPARTSVVYQPEQTASKDDAAAATNSATSPTTATSPTSATNANSAANSPTAASPTTAANANSAANTNSAANNSAPNTAVGAKPEDKVHNAAGSDSNFHSGANTVTETKTASDAKVDLNGNAKVDSDGDSRVGSKIKNQSLTKNSSPEESNSQALNRQKVPTGAVLVRQDDPEKVLHIDVDLEHSGS